MSRKLLLSLQDFFQKGAVDPMAGTNQKENLKNETTYGYFKIMNVFVMFRLVVIVLSDYAIRKVEGIYWWKHINSI